MKRLCEPRPDAAVTHNNLGTLLAGEPGREAEAIAQYEAALRAGSRSAEANSNLGYMLVSQPGRQAEAIAHCRPPCASSPIWRRRMTTWDFCSPVSLAGKTTPLSNLRRLCA